MEYSHVRSILMEIEYDNENFVSYKSSFPADIPAEQHLWRTIVKDSSTFTAILQRHIVPLIFLPTKRAAGLTLIDTIRLHGANPWPW
jgi:hypothetical protein